jgi:chromosome segregation ATPase
LLKKQHLMKQAVEDSELAIAVLQRKLADSEAACCEAQQEVKAVKHSADVMRGDLEQKVRTATEDGNLRVRLLEETVSKLGNRSDHAAEVARLSSEVSTLQRSKARMQSDLIFAEDRVESLTRELQETTSVLIKHEANQREADVYRIHGAITEAGNNKQSAMALLSESDVRDRERKSHQDMLAKLVERAEKAEVELGSAQSQLGQLQQQLRASRGAQACGTGAILSASKVFWPAPVTF